VGPKRGGLEPRFFFDRNLGKRVPEALENDGWLVETHDDHFAQDASDETLFHEVSARGWIFITQDKRIRFRAAERHALLEYGLRTFSLVSTANLSASETIEVLRRAHQAIEETVATIDGPWVFGIYKDGSLRPLNVTVDADQDEPGQ
jgi:predicted nuclease of predicted toxin-antitoxin system